MGLAQDEAWLFPDFQRGGKGTSLSQFTKSNGNKVQADIPPIQSDRPGGGTGHRRQTDDQHKKIRVRTLV